MRKHFQWILVTAIVLMLLAMFAYVASDDEAFPTSPPAAEQGTE